MNKLLKDERGQFTYVLLFIAIFVVLLITFSIVIPILQGLTIGFWGATSNAINPMIQAQISSVNDGNYTAMVQGSFDSQTQMQATTEELFSLLVTYAGIITIFVVFMAWLLIGRRNVEAGGLA